MASDAGSRLSPRNRSKTGTSGRSTCSSPGFHSPNPTLSVTKQNFEAKDSDMRKSNATKEMSLCRDFRAAHFCAPFALAFAFADQSQTRPGLMICLQAHHKKTTEPAIRLPRSRPTFHHPTLGPAGKVAHNPIPSQVAAPGGDPPRTDA